jgi:ribosomal protein S18 acetylase RimI-like enzyme
MAKEVEDAEELKEAAEVKEAEGVTVRPARPEDAEGITSVHIRAWQWGYAGLIPAAYLASLDQTGERRVRERRTHLAAIGEEAAVFVATTTAGEVVGFANVGDYRNPDNRNPGNRNPDNPNPEAADREGEVYAIYVSQDVAGTGVGRALMDEAVAWLRGRGRYPIRLWVLDGNARARAFYERYGFRLDGGRGTYTVEQAGELPVDLAELRYCLGG